jgi:archaetidylinositol phosphate synthase
VSASTEIRSDASRAGESRRAGRELVLEHVFQPLANALASILARMGVAPPAVVLANTGTGLVAAFAIARGDLLAAALLLQLKTLLDNADGRLARVTGRVTLSGRYLDTEADLLVNAAVFAALGHATGEPLLAAAAFAALTFVLAVDYNLTELYRQARGLSHPPPAPVGGRVERALERTYDAFFGRLDRFVRALSRRRFDRVVGADDRPEVVRTAWLAYVDRVTVTVLANFGLTTQLAVLGVCLAVGRPALALWLVLACLVALVPLQLRAEARTRSALSTPRAA